MLLYLKIKPNQRFDRIEKSEGQWIIRIKAPAIDGKANEYVVKYLGIVTGIAPSKIRLRKGHTSRIKCLEIDAEPDYINHCLLVESLKSAQ